MDGAKTSPATNSYYSYWWTRLTHTGGLDEKNCVFLSTTLDQGNLPDVSIYPKDEESGDYWRVSVPPSHFNQLRIKSCDKQDEQVLLILCSPSDFADCTDVTDDPNNGYLYRDNQGKWFSNDYSNPNTQYYVNIAILQNVDISGCEWDSVFKIL